MTVQDTIVAVSTPPGRGGIGVIRLSGVDSLTLTRRLLVDQNFSPTPHRVSLKILREPQSGEVLDHCLITYFKSPQSFTGEDVVELSCHGSPIVLLQIVDTLLALGARTAEPGEFTLRAVSNGRLNLSQAEAVRDLIDARTESAVKQAARQLGGELSARLQPFKDAIIEIIVLLESSLEFVEDDLPAQVFESSNLTGNYGVAIIILTFIIYSLFFPLKWRSTRAMKKTAKLQPQMKEIQEKMKSLKSDDPRLKELQMEQLRLMKEGNFLGGCLPMLIQMPFFFALFRAITISIDFRQAEFLYLRDLSAADPYHALPIMMGASMLGLQLSTPMPTQEPAQRWMMAIMLPVMMLYMMWSAPSGLLLYWFCGNIIMFGQQMLINRLIKSKDEQEPPPADAKLTRSNKIKPSVSNA